MRCDSHVHIVGPADRYPQVAERTYLADVATLKQLERVSASRAIRRFVIVQPSFYGTDNGMLLEGLDALAGRGRGVAVINPDTTSARTLSGMASQGVRGLRLNLYSPLREKAPLAARFEAVEGHARDLNWHIEVIAPIKLLSENASLLRNSRVPVVIDHYGLYAGTRPGSARRHLAARAACAAPRLDQVVGAIPCERGSARNPGRSGLGRSHLKGRVRSLRVGQRLAAHTAARPAYGQRRPFALSKSSLRNTGRRFHWPRPVRWNWPSEFCRTTRRGSTALNNPYRLFCGGGRDAHVGRGVQGVCTRRECEIPQRHQGNRRNIAIVGSSAAEYEVFGCRRPRTLEFSAISA